MHIRSYVLLAFLLVHTCVHLFSQQAQELDVLAYQLRLTPNLQEQSIEGVVTIRFCSPTESKEVWLQCGSLKILEVKGAGIHHSKQEGNQLRLSLKDRTSAEQEVQITYQGNPRKGLVFLTDPMEAYTIFFTNEWMVCHDTPGDFAPIHIDILIPDSLMCIASGEFQGQKTIKEGWSLHSYTQAYATPAYVYGWAIGSFSRYQEQSQHATLYSYSSSYSLPQLAGMSKEMANMLDFFVQKSGVPYPQSTYSQLFIGNHYQEMSGFSVLKRTYGELVLSDSTETNLISHELAHQWWGNRICCETWTHFWLNEGFATFMSAAYNEYRFGTEKYMADIESYRNVYQKIKARGNDKALVFDRWTNPSGDDRNLVYFKGAYVLHLLKEKLGDEDFWTGIRYYSQMHLGSSVSTSDFQRAMEQSSNKNLEDFFKRWIYTASD
ncbi:MAG: M1 family aminopeptidase [Bacteroidota bacterium]